VQLVATIVNRSATPFNVTFQGTAVAVLGSTVTGVATSTPLALQSLQITAATFAMSAPHML
jgi:hypothetical protein